MKHTQLVQQAICSVSIFILAGCNLPMNPPAPQAQATPISCKIPVITPLVETKESQEKGGVEISIAPFPYKAVKKKVVTHNPVEPNAAEMLFEPYQNLQYFEEITATTFEPSTKRLAYVVKINNKLNRVFRGAGAVVQFNDGGKLVAVDQSGYQQLTGAIVPPRSELQVTIFGPALDQVADKATVGLFFYDVVTAVNEAGAVIEKQNYEWYFAYNTKVVEDTGTTQTRRIKMPRGYTFPEHRTLPGGN